MKNIKKLLPIIMMGDSSGLNKEASLLAFSKVNKEKDMPKKEAQNAIFFAGMFTKPGDYFMPLELANGKINKHRRTLSENEAGRLKVGLDKADEHVLELIEGNDGTATEKEKKFATYLKMVHKGITKTSYNNLKVAKLDKSLSKTVTKYLPDG